MNRLKNATIDNAELYMASGSWTAPYLAITFHAENKVKICAGGTSAPNTPVGVLICKEVITEREEVLFNEGDITVAGSWENGKQCSFVTKGKTLARVGTAGATAGALAMVEASTGKFVDHSAGGNVVGVFQETGTEGDLVWLDVNPYILGRYGTPA